jgi:preprotein translocase subunit SecG
MTRNGAIAFFVLSFGLYLAHIAREKAARAESILPKIEVPAAAAPAATPAAAPAASAEPAPAVSVSLPTVGTPAATPAPAEPAK